jgi:hypothetical protein
MKPVLAVLMCLFLSAAAGANPPEGADQRMAPWFHSLLQPGTGMPCCSIADCRPTDFRSTGNHYEAMINGKWLEVLADKVIHRSENPTGRAIVCWTPVHGILCFIPGPEA